jgi:hypothetical protein
MVDGSFSRLGKSSPLGKLASFGYLPWHCLVPFNSFAEYGAEPRDEEEGRGLVCAQRRQTADSVRGYLDRVQRRPRHEVETDPGPHLVYGFLTTSPNAIVEPIHSKAAVLRLQLGSPVRGRGVADVGDRETASAAAVQKSLRDRFYTTKTP